MRRQALASTLLLSTLVLQPLLATQPRAEAQPLASPAQSLAASAPSGRVPTRGTPTAGQDSRSPLLPQATPTPVWPHFPAHLPPATGLPLGTAKSAKATRLVAGYGQLPLAFEANRGQTDGRVRFLARVGGYTLFLTGSEAVLTLAQPQKPQPAPHAARKAGRLDPRASLLDPRLQRPAPARMSVIRLRFLGANPHPQLVGLDQLAGKVNYFIGKNPKQWHTNIPTYARVGYRDLYPGIDLAFYGRAGHLEYDWIVRPGGDPSRILLGIVGAPGMRLDRQGNLLLVGASGVLLRQERPVAYQTVAGQRHPVAVRSTLLGRRPGGSLEGLLPFAQQQTSTADRDHPPAARVRGPPGGTPPRERRRVPVHLWQTRGHRRDPLARHPPVSHPPYPLHRTSARPPRPYPDRRSDQRNTPWRMVRRCATRQDTPLTVRSAHGRCARRMTLPTSPAVSLSMTLFLWTYRGAKTIMA